MNTLAITLQKHAGRSVVIGIMIFALLVSWIALMPKSLRLDETQSVGQTNHTLVGTLHVIAADVHVPLYFVLLHTWIMAFGFTAGAMRMLSLIFLLLSFPTLYILAKDSYPKKIAIWSVLLAGFSPFLHWYGSEARMYTLLFLITALNHIFFLRLASKDKATVNTWILYGATVLLGAYTHLFFGFILLVQIAFYLRHRPLFGEDSMKKFLIVAGLASVELIGWFFYRLLVGSANSSPLLPPPTTSDFFNLFSNAYIGLQANYLNSFFLALWPLFVLLGFTLLARREKITAHTAYLLQSTFFPIILAFLISIVGKPLFVSRYLIIVLPSLYILSAYLISLYKPRTANILLCLVLGSMSFSLIVEAVSPEVPVNENYREASTHIASAAHANDIFVVSAPFTTYPIEYYYRGVAPMVTFPLWSRYQDSENIPPFTEQELIDASGVWAENHEYLYLLQSYDQGYEETTRIYFDTHYERVSHKEFSPGLNLYVYKLKYL
ncbi:MAG: glycosyltransferase family 39 protein [Patescibacteria group bacterium]